MKDAACAVRGQGLSVMNLQEKSPLDVAASNTLSGAEAMVEMLKGHGVKHIFGLCGDTTLPFYDALYRLDHGMEHILTRDERSAAYMADAYARVSGRVGVCEGPSGGGATYILPGLVEANESSVPVLAITSDVSVTSRGRYPLTELDQDALMRPLTKWNSVITEAGMLPRMVRAAFRAMTTGRPGSAHIGLPFNVQKGAVSPDDVFADPAHGAYPAWPAGPDEAAVEAAAEALVNAKRPVIVCGGGVVISGAEGELARLAERLDIAVATTISGRGSIAETHDNAVGVVGSNGGVPATRGIVDEADLVVFIGCRAGSVTTERWRSPGPDATIVHIDCDPMAIGANYRTHVAVCADARLALAALNRVLDGEQALAKHGGAARAGVARARKWAAFETLSRSPETPIRPERLIADLRSVLDDDAVIVADPGTPCPYLSAYYEVRRTGRTVFSNRAHGALGYSLSAAIGAAYGRPGVKVVSMMGDGSFGFACGELETVTRYKLPITFIVVSNSVFGWIKAGQKAGFGERYYSVDFSETDHAGVAAAFGIKSWRVADPDQLAGVLKQAVAHDGPTLVDVVCQPLHEVDAPVSEWIA
jgi:acetolactate synthase-1/2/3 large subunit